MRLQTRRTLLARGFPPESVEMRYRDYLASYRDSFRWLTACGHLPRSQFTLWSWYSEAMRKHG